MCDQIRYHLAPTADNPDPQRFICSEHMNTLGRRNSGVLPSGKLYSVGFSWENATKPCDEELRERSRSRG